MTIQILEPKESYTIDYPWAVELSIMQADIIWHPETIEVEKDLHDLKTIFTPAEYHGVVSTLKLFTLYEQKVGGDYWRDIISKLFPRPDIIRMASTFSFMELGVHAPFYNEINRVLGLDTDEFYTSYLDDPVLTNRMKWIGRRVGKIDTHFDRLKSIAIFSLIEGAVLYSSFAYLKHFQNQGKNKLVHINDGINYSVQDEDIHAIGGSLIYKTYLKELMEYHGDSYIAMGDDANGVMDVIHPKEFLHTLKEEIREVSTIIFEHEHEINKKIFEKGSIEGININQLDYFTQSRIDLQLERLDIPALFKPEQNPIASWFYNNINSSILHDFFYKHGNDYSRKWKERSFKW